MQITEAVLLATEDGKQELIFMQEMELFSYIYMCIYNMYIYVYI